MQTSTSQETDSRAQIQSILEQLRGTSVTDPDELLCLLASPLDAIGLLPPQYRRYLNFTDAASNLNVSIRSHIPQLQRVLLTHVYPTWAPVLSSTGSPSKGVELLAQYFCPDAFLNSTAEAGEVALLAYSTLLSTMPMTSYATELLARLTVEYPVDRLFKAAFDSKGKNSAHGSLIWEDCVRNLCMVPDKVANAVHGAKTSDKIPEVLENATYFDTLCIRCEELIYSLSQTRKKGKQVASASEMSSLTYLFSKLVGVGIFPPRPPVARSQPSFFQSTLPTIRKRLESRSELVEYSNFWNEIFIAIPSSMTLQSILTSLVASITPSVMLVDPPTSTTDGARSNVRREAAILFGLVGKLTPEKSELWEIATGLMTTTRDWPEAYARVFVCWTSGGAMEGGKVDLKGTTVLESLLELVLDVWSSPEHIKHSLMSRHRYTTTLLLLTVSYFPRSSPVVQSLVAHPNFIKSISTYISHLDASVRRCGMLAAEVIAQLCGQKLSFGDWDGDDQGKPWCLALRKLLEQRDVDAPLENEASESGQLEEMPVEEITSASATQLMDNSADKSHAKVNFVKNADGYDSDDSLEGYASEEESDRSVSPTPEELNEIEKDPTLNVGRKKVPRPVYLAQLGALLRGTGTKQPSADDPHEADRIEMALLRGEELIRRKRAYGTELSENAVNLVFAFLGLQDNFNLGGFSERRQGALNALVACAPRQATPALIQEFFKNQYSVDQRFVALNAIALGARELASLSIPPSIVPAERTAFPSKTLPAPLHRKYTAPGTANAQIIPQLMDSISKQALNKERASAGESVPEIARQRRLRIQKKQPVIEEVSSSLALNPFSTAEKSIPKPPTRFIDVSAEFFIMPLINYFWTFLHDEQAREQRTSGRTGRGKYHGAGTGLILNALVLAQFIRTLAILVNASQNAPQWLSIIVPNALELAVTLGTRPMSHMEDEDGDDEDGDDEDGDDEDGDDEDGDDEDGDESDKDEARKGKEASLVTSAMELALVILDGAMEADGGRVLGLEHPSLVFGLAEWAGKVFASLDKGLKMTGGGGMHEQRLSRAAAGVLLKVDELTSKWRRSMIQDGT